VKRRNDLAFEPENKKPYTSEALSFFKVFGVCHDLAPKGARNIYM
jgi:hypothetical protein